MDEGQEGSIKLVIASKDPSKPLELLEEAFNQMPFFVGVPINRPRIRNIALRWDRIGGFLRINIVADRFCAIRFITKNIASLNIDLTEQGDRVLGIMIIAGTEQKSKRKPSTKAWIFVFLPPLDTPTALFSVFFPTVGALMHLAGG